MKTNDPEFFHKLYGVKKPRVCYYDRDFVDYVVMLALCGAVVWAAYGTGQALTLAGWGLCAFALLAFVARHGLALKVPLVLRRPQDVVYMVVYKLQNVRPIYFVALGLLVLEGLFVAATPNLPHQTEFMRRAALAAFYLHLGAITVYRTVILVDHLLKKEHVRSVLVQTPWKRVINDKTNITLEILHAYATGLLAHLLLVAPWFLAIRYASYSLLFLPLACAANFVLHQKWMSVYNAWFYRDHWLGHNSELEFLYLHGPHHDAIPSALIAVSDAGFLEGFVRFATASPVAFYNPAFAFLIYMFEVKTDVEMHQYIPGVFPRLPKQVLEVFQHSTHHYWRLEPYSVAAKLDRPNVTAAVRRRFAALPEPMRNSFKLDEQLTGFQWDNPTHLSVLELWDRYRQ